MVKYFLVYEAPDCDDVGGVAWEFFRITFWAASKKEAEKKSIEHLEVVDRNGSGGGLYKSRIVFLSKIITGDSIDVDSEGYNPIWPSRF